jgi:hypothetical protein
MAALPICSSCSPVRRVPHRRPRERVELRARVTGEIDRLDQELLTPPPRPSPKGEGEGNARRKDVRERRDRLADDLELLDRSDERGWDELKGDIENDLAP